MSNTSDFLSTFFSESSNTSQQIVKQLAESLLTYDSSSLMQTPSLEDLAHVQFVFTEPETEVQDFSRLTFSMFTNLNDLISDAEKTAKVNWRFDGF